MTLGEAWEDFFEKIIYPFRVGGTLDKIGNTMLDIGMGALQSYYQDEAKKKGENFLKCRMCGTADNPAIEYDHDMICCSCLQKIRTLPGVEIRKHLPSCRRLETHITKPFPSKD